MIQSTDSPCVGEEIGITVKPEEIHIMKKSEYSGKYGDYSTFSDEMDHLADEEEE